MLDKLQRAWQARRVLLIGGADETTGLLKAHFTALGARPVSLPPCASREALYRALTDGRVSAVIACVPLDAGAQNALRTELRETGVPLALFCPQMPAQEAALWALSLGARCLTGDLPCGIYGAEAFNGGQRGEASPEPDAFHPDSCPAGTNSGRTPPHTAGQTP